MMAYIDSANCGLKVIISTILKHSIFNHRSSHCAESFTVFFWGVDTLSLEDWQLTCQPGTVCNIYQRTIGKVYFFHLIVSLLFWSLSLPSSIYFAIEYLGTEFLKKMHVSSFGARIVFLLLSLFFPLREMLAMAPHSELTCIGQYLCSGQSETATSW